MDSRNLKCERPTPIVAAEAMIVTAEEKKHGKKKPKPGGGTTYKACTSRLRGPLVAICVMTTSRPNSENQKVKRLAFSCQTSWNVPQTDRLVAKGWFSVCLY